MSARAKHIETVPIPVLNPARQTFHLRFSSESLQWVLPELWAVSQNITAVVINQLGQLKLINLKLISPMSFN